MALSPNDLQLATKLLRGAALTPVRGLENSAENDDALNQLGINLALLIFALNSTIDAIVANDLSGAYERVTLSGALGAGAPVLIAMSGLVLLPGVWDALPINSQIETMWNWTLINTTGGPLGGTMSIPFGDPPTFTSPIVGSLVTSVVGGGTETNSLWVRVVKTAAGVARAEFGLATESGTPAAAAIPLNTVLPVSGNGVSFAAIWTGPLGLNSTGLQAQATVFKKNVNVA